MNYVRLTLGVCYALLTSTLYGMRIDNNSDSPKHVELIAYIPSSGPQGGFAPQTIAKQNLQPGQKFLMQSPFSLRDVSVDMTWGGEKLVKPEDRTLLRTVEKDTAKAQKWVPLKQTKCGNNRTVCDIVIPQTWRIQEDAQGVTLHTDANTTLKAATLEELLTQIPYRRIVDTTISRHILANNKTSASVWKKFGKSGQPGEEIVIPQSWKMSTKENNVILTTDAGTEISIPLTRKMVTNQETKKTHTEVYADTAISLKAIPFRRKGNIVFETVQEDRIVIAEETPAEPFKTSQFNLFRRFSPQDALPVSSVCRVPDRVGNGHVFEITGSGYDADVTLAYAPDTAEPEAIPTKRNETTDPNQNAANSTHPRSRKTVKQ